MARLVMVKMGEKDGINLYAPLDAEDEKLVNGRDALVLETVGNKAGITELQNKSIHKYLTLLAEALNAAGLDMKVVLAKLSKRMDIPWTMASAKERLWRPVQVAQLEKESTTKLDTREVSMVYETLSKLMAENFSISVSFPDKFYQMADEYQSENKQLDKSHL